MKPWVLALLALTLACQNGEPTLPPADLLLTEASVYTVSGKGGFASTVAIGGGRIRYVGSRAGAAPFVGETTRVVGLQGRMVLPGFQDVHVHPVHSGVTYRECALFGLTSVEALVAKVKACAEADPTAPWVRGGGWSVDNFAPSGLPDKALLDAVVLDRPVSLKSSDGHSLWVNSKALEVAGIDTTTPDPEHGLIDRYPGTREPSGSLQEDSAMLMVMALEPRHTDRELEEGLRDAVKVLNGFGITAVQDAIVKLDPGDAYDGFRAYHALDARGELHLRVVAAMYWQSERGVDEQVARFIEARERNTKGRVRATSIKIWQDGVLETGTAALLEPYLDRDDSHRGLLMNEQARLDDAVTKLDGAGFQVHFHAIGDRAIRSCLDAVEVAQRTNGIRDARHHISHVQLLHPDDIPRFPELGVVANFQPLWAFADRYITELTIPRLGPERSRYLYPMASFRAAGARLAFGSDWYVSSPNPLLGIETAVTRLDPEGDGGEVFLPDERISLEDAIAAYTLHAAFVNSLDAETGSIEVGKLADLVVLDRNLFDIPPAEISEVQTVATLVEGRVVHGALP